MYLEQHGKYLEVKLKGSKAPNRKQEKNYFSIVLALAGGLNPEPFSPESSTLPSEQLHVSLLTFYLNCVGFTPLQLQWPTAE